MNLIRHLGKTALVAVFLFVLSCSGGSEFKPAPGASIEQDELEGLITAAVDGFDLQAVSFIPLPIDAGNGGLKSCFEVESGPCAVPRPPGLSAAFQSSDGASVLVNVLLAVDEQEASDLVNNAELSRTTTSSAAMRVQYAGGPPPENRIFGPCDAKADPGSDEGCAWQKRGAPGVGDEARGMKSEVLDNQAFSMVAFARADVFVSVEVLKRGSSDAPNGLVDGIAKALDEQVKQALSR